MRLSPAWNGPKFFDEPRQRADLLLPGTVEEKFFGRFLGLADGLAGQGIWKTKVATLGAEHVSVPSEMIDDDATTREPSFDGDFDTLATPTTKVFVADIQVPIFVTGEQKTTALERHRLGQVAFGFGTAFKIVKILEVGLRIETVRSTLGIGLRYPHDITGGRLAAFGTNTTGSLIAGVALGADPVKSV